MSHFLFTAATLRERSSLDSAELQLSHRLWGCCTALIQHNLAAYLTAESHGLVYVLKAGLCAEFRIVSPVLRLQDMDDLLREDLRTEARYGFIRVEPIRRWRSTPQESHALLQEILQIPDQAELTRRLSLGMHRLTDAEYQAIVQRLGPGIPVAS
ncbi:hypothetical protein [Nitrospira moscoviensis]|jgi:hypothetical protein|uniref:EVE domain-containing protein n=1 Tax=Nitrospira moscoviensis TaxID=42253 RepID=A0A0K2G9Z4_NITMO|nr:hypothetical protein [Nitrospira moscoviensis]ALA57765.1 hypothetical protein NITMOv2_1337 [Nitrospira moscoviensis]